MKLDTASHDAAILPEHELDAALQLAIAEQTGWTDSALASLQLLQIHRPKKVGLAIMSVVILTGSPRDWWAA